MSGFNSARVAVGLFLMCASLAGPLGRVREARADGPPPDEPTRQAQAKALFEAATARLDQGDLTGALERYRAAYELVPRAKILRNIGAVLLELGRRAEAAETFASYLEREDAEPDRVAEITGLLAGLDRELGRLWLRVDQQGALVRLDGVLLGIGPLELRRRVAPGAHVLAIERPGQGRETRTLELEPGVEREVAIAASVESPPAAAPAPGGSADGARGGSASGSGGGSISGRIELPAPDSGRVLPFLRVDVDLAGRGALIAPGVGLRLGQSWLVYANALVGERAGGELGLRWTLGAWAVRPYATASGTVLVEDGARPGVRGAAGARWRLAGPAEMSVELGAAHAFSVPDGFVSTVGLGSFAVAIAL